MSFDDEFDDLLDKDDAEAEDGVKGSQSPTGDKKSGLEADAEGEDDEERRALLTLSGQKKKRPRSEAQPFDQYQPVISDKEHKLRQKSGPEELARLDTWRQANISIASMKMIVVEILGAASKAEPNVHHVLAGLSRLFIGSIVEEALAIKREWDVADNEPHLLPIHLQEAYRRLMTAGKIPTAERSLLKRRK
eukprot:g24409.t1